MSTEAQKNTKGAKKAPAPATTDTAAKAPVAKGPQQEVIILPPNVKAMLDAKQGEINALINKLNAEIELGIKFFLGGKGLTFEGDDLITLAPDNSQILVTRMPKKK